MAGRRSDGPTEQGGGPGPWRLQLLGLRRWGRPAADEPLALRPRIALLLGRVALAGAGGVDRAALAEALWPERPPGRAAHSLTQSLSELRRRFAGTLQPVVARDGRLVLAAGVVVDVDEVRRDLAGPDPAARLAAAERARGGLLDGLYADSPELDAWLDGARRELARDVHDALVRTLDEALVAGERGSALAAVDALVALDPLDEEAHARGVELRLAEGRPRDALRRAEAAAAVIARELDAEPGPRLRALLRRAQRSRSDAPAPGPPRLGVLPFTATVADPTIASLAAALPRVLAERLASHRDLAVLAPGATLTAAPATDPVGRLRRQFDADFAIEGSFGVVDGAPTLTLAVVDCASRCVAWTQRSAVAEREVGAFMAAMATRIAAALTARYARAAAAAPVASGGAELEAFALYARARELYDALSPAGHLAAWELAGAAIARDPSLGQAWLLRAYLAEGLLLRGCAVDREDLAAARRDAIARAHALDPWDGRTLIELGDLHLDAGDAAAARRCYRAAADDPAAETRMIAAKYCAGTLDRPAEARAMLAEAARLHAPDAPWLASNALRTYVVLGDTDAALGAAGRAPHSPLHVVCRAVALHRAGASRSARELVADERATAPGFDPRALARSPFLSPYLQAPVARRRFLADLDAIVGPRAGQAPSARVRISKNRWSKSRA